jgi:hypothetical protein
MQVSIDFVDEDDARHHDFRRVVFGKRSRVHLATPPTPPPPYPDHLHTPPTPAPPYRDLPDTPSTLPAS